MSEKKPPETGFALGASMRSILKNSARLNKATDLAAATVRQVEEFLNEKCSVGVETSITVSEAEDEAVYLRYTRHSGKFRIVVIESDRYNGESQWKPWGDCARDVKLETFAKIPDLLKQIAANLESKLDATEATSATVEQLLNNLAAQVAEPAAPPPGTSPQTDDYDIPF